MYYFKKKPKKKEDPVPLFSSAGIKIKRKPDLVKKLDKVFSLYIRLRDTMPSGYFKCISCGQIKPFAKADCGHYFSRRSMSTRFDEDNCHAECNHCNRFVADHLDGYRKNLIAKIGEQRFLKLEWKHNQTRHYADFELQELITYYKGIIEDMKKEKGL